MIKKIKRSPLFYVGDKYRLMKQLLGLFPKEINNFYEPFVGGGTVFLNMEAKKYFLNDIDKHLVNIHKLLISGAERQKDFLRVWRKSFINTNYLIRTRMTLFQTPLERSLEKHTMQDLTRKVTKNLEYMSTKIEKMILLFCTFY